MSKYLNIAYSIEGLHCVILFWFYNLEWQITADKSASCGASRNIPLAVRTLYEVHCLTSQIEV